MLPVAGTDEVLVAADELWIMDRLLTGLVVIDCFWFISLLEGRKTIFFLHYFFFFFFGNKIPQTNKIRSKKRQRIQFRFPKNTWGHKPLPAASPLIQAIRDDLRPVSSLPHSSVCFSSLLTSFSKSFLDLSSSSKHCFILLFSFEGKNKGIKMQLMPMHFTQRGTSVRLAAWCPSYFKQAEASSWKPNFSLGWRTLFSWGGLSHFQAWGWREEDVFPLRLQELVSTRPL